MNWKVMRGLWFHLCNRFFVNYNVVFEAGLSTEYDRSIEANAARFPLRMNQIVLFFKRCILRFSLKHTIVRCPEQPKYISLWRRLSRTNWFEAPLLIRLWPHYKIIFKPPFHLAIMLSCLEQKPIEECAIWLLIIVCMRQGIIASLSF